MKKITSLFAALFCVAMFANADVVGTINNAIPEGWSYITNNDKYPDPAYYKDGGLKLNFEGQGILSPKFDAAAAVDVVLTVNALNQNTKTAASEDAFTITGLDANGATVATATLKTVEKGDNTAKLAGEGIAQVKIIMTGYPYDGAKYCNVSLGAVKLVAGNTGGGTTDPTPTEKVLVPTYAEADYYDTDWQIILDDSDDEGENASFIAFLDFMNDKPTSIAGTWTNFVHDYTALYTIAGTDTTFVDYTALSMTLTWLTTMDVSETFEGYTQCGIYSIEVSYKGEDNVLYSIKADALPIITWGEDDFINVTDKLENVAADELNIRIADGAIILNVQAPVEIYTTAGQLLYMTTANGELTINGMPRNQALIVRIGDKAAKVIL